MINEDKLYIDIVKMFAETSHCCKIKVASLAVKDRSPICIGINGTSPGSENCDEHFLEYQIKMMRELENDLSDNVYNYTFGGYLKTLTFSGEHHKWAEIHEFHAEQNLVGRANRQGISLTDCIIYQTHFPCTSCAKLLSTLGIKELVYIEDYDRQENESLEILKANNILVRQYKEED
jgi:dCMP deaminase